MFNDSSLSEDKLNIFDREYVGLFNWKKILKDNAKTCMHGAKPKSQFFIQALEEKIGMDNDLAINNMITVYPACVSAHHIDNEFSAFAVCAQREDNTDLMMNYNMIYRVLRLAPMGIKHD